MTRIEIYKASKPKKSKGIFFVDYHLNNSHLKVITRTYLNIFDAEKDISHYGGYKQNIKDGFYVGLCHSIYSLNYGGETSKYDFPNSLETMILIRKFESELNDSILRLKEVCEKLGITPNIELKKQVIC